MAGGTGRDEPAGRIAAGFAAGAARRAQAYERLECPRAAVGDLVAYLSLAVSPADAGQVRGRLGRLQQAAARLN